jgi:Uma2 family endonuclease
VLELEADGRLIPVTPTGGDIGRCNTGGAKALRQKMAEYKANGARLGWLLFLEERTVEIWQPQSNATALMEPRFYRGCQPIAAGSARQGHYW